MSIDLEMEEILKVFFEESAEGLDAMESGLLDLDAAADREKINTIFRAAHSIKGGAGTFGFTQIAEFTHAVETLLDQMRNGTRAVTADAVQVLLQAVDVMREMTDAAQAGRPIESAAALALTAKLAALLQSTAGDAGDVADAPGWRIEFRPRTALFKNRSDPLRLFAQLETLGALEVTVHDSGVPSVADMDPTQCYLAWTLVLRAPVAQSRLAEVFAWADADAVVEFTPMAALVPPAEARPTTARVVPPPAEPSPSTSISPSPSPVLAAPAAPMPPAAGRAATDAGSIRVATEKVDALINLVGELVITQSMLGRFSGGCDAADLEALRRGLSQLARNTRELQESVLKIRMLPISFSFNRFPRLVHELSRRLGKKIELRLNGEGTELDKTVLEKIGDPLVHLVRNSLDHGFETPAARVAAGKPETGVLELNAFHEGGNVIIEVKDDGAGLNKARILAKARERGLIDPDANLSDEQIYNLIFVPGFSTADTVSDTSGRGVGMDVVRRNINDLGGHVQVHSVAGRGSTMRIRLPLTLAILEGQVLRVGREVYVISLISIIETVQPRRVDLHSLSGRAEVFRHREEYLPLIRLHELFGIEPDSRDIGQGLLIVVESEGRRAALLVDELLAQQQVVIKSLDTNFRQLPGLAGATIHGDGTVALILDVPGVIARFLDTPRPGEQVAA